MYSLSNSTLDDGIMGFLEIINCLINKFVNTRFGILSGSYSTNQCWQIAIIELEGGEPRRATYVRINCKFYDWKFIHPIRLIGLNDRSQDLSDRVIGSFGSTIHLRVECCRHQ